MITLLKTTMDPYIISASTNHGANQVHICAKFAKYMSKSEGFYCSVDRSKELSREKYFINEFVKCANYLSTSTSEDLRKIRFE